MSKLQDYLEQKPELAGEKYLWKQSAAAALEVSEKTLERAAKNGKIAQIEKNRKTLYLIEDLFSFEADQSAEIHKPVVESDTPGQTPTEQSLQTTEKGFMQTLETNQKTFPAPMSAAPADLQSRLVMATIEKAEFEALHAYLNSNLTFALDEVAERLNLSIVDLRKTAKTFRGKNSRMMITRDSLDKYLSNL